MNEAFVEVNKVRTKVCTWGRWIEESPGNTNELIVLIPGNPGVVGFYNHFAKTLYEKSEIPVWCVGHAGHNFADKALTKFPEFKENTALYGLKGQVDHKIDFFKKYIPNDAKVYLIGHSIGSYMALEILDHPDVKAKIKKTYLLFPTIETMAKTKYGRFLNTFIRPIVPFILFLSWVFTLMPALLANALLYVYMFLTNFPWDLHNENIKALVRPGLLKRIFFLAFEEMDQVNERNNGAIERNIDKLKLCYGRTDEWAPESYYNKVKHDFPNVNAELVDINHSFVIKESQIVAGVVADWIRNEK